MSRKAKTLTLTAEQRRQLSQIDKSDSDWRERRRARTVLLLGEGKSVAGVAAEQNIHKETVACHRDAWLARGFDGLRDLPRSGAPRKLSETHRQLLCAWVQEGAFTAPQLRSRLSAEHGVQVSLWLVQSALKEQGQVWNTNGCERRARRKHPASPTSMTE
jgi:transposase